MTTQHFDRWQDIALVRGQHNLANILRELLYRTNPDTFECMDFDDDRAFLLPHLFAHFTLNDDSHNLKALVEQQHHEPPPSPEWACKGHVPNLFARLFTADGHALPRALPAATVRRHQTHLLRALQLLRRHCPRIAQRLQHSTRYVYLYQAALPNSFASLSAHGAVFFNVPDGADEVYFLEDMAHQCAHVAFNAMTHDKARYFQVSPYLALGRLLDDDAEQRTLYTVFHALYTYVLIADALMAALDAEALDERQLHEARGRLAYTLLKFRIDLQHMSRPEIYTPKGRLLHRRFAAHCDRQTCQANKSVQGLDLSNQPYNFSYAHFVELNPCEVLQRGAA